MSIPGDGRRRQAVYAVIVASLFLAAAYVDADPVVVPNALELVAGNSPNTLPFNTGFFAEPLRTQQVFGAEEFDAFDGPTLITRMSLRPPFDPFATAFSAVIGDVQINLSTTARAPDGLSLVFSENVGPDDMAVYDGALTLASTNIGPAAGPKVFDIIIDLQQPFSYDPALGNLLLDVRQFTGGDAFRSVGYDAHFEPGDSISRVGGHPTDDVALFADTLGVVVQFNGPAPSVPPVPAPPTIWLLASGLLVLRTAVAARSRRP